MVNSEGLNPLSEELISPKKMTEPPKTASNIERYEQYVLLNKRGMAHECFIGMLDLAKHEHVDAMWDVGSMLLQGNGCRKNLKEAERWLKLASKYNNDGRIFLGDLYTIRGLYENALVEYQLAVNYGDVADVRDAFTAMGDIYAHHTNDTKLALHYYSKAGEHPDSLLGMAYLYEREGAYEDSFQYFERSAAAGSNEGNYGLALYYFEGSVVDKDLEMAAQCFEKANNFSPALYQLGLMYMDGIGVEKSFEKSIQMLLKATKQGHSEARNKLVAIASDLTTNKSLDPDMQSIGLSIVYKLNDYDVSQ